MCKGETWNSHSEGQGIGSVDKDAKWKVVDLQRSGKRPRKSDPLIEEEGEEILWKTVLDKDNYTFFSSSVNISK